jgi:hypothetical protein
MEGGNNGFMQTFNPALAADPLDEHSPRNSL